MVFICSSTVCEVVLPVSPDISYYLYQQINPNVLDVSRQAQSHFLNHTRDLYEWWLIQDWREYKNTAGYRPVTNNTRKALDWIILTLELDS